MAMIKCPECEMLVSDKAFACPKCGYPISKLTEQENIKSSLHDSEITADDKDSANDDYSADMENNPEVNDITEYDSEEAEATENTAEESSTVSEENTDTHETVTDNTTNGNNNTAYTKDFSKPIEPNKPPFNIAEANNVNDGSSKTKVNTQVLKGIVVAALIVLFIVVVAALSRVNAKKEAIAFNSELQALTEVSASDGAKLNDLQKQYDNMSDYQKTFVTSYKQLEQAKAIQRTLVFRNKVDELNFKNVDDITTDTSVDTINSYISSVKSLKDEYSQLTDFQKKYIGDTTNEVISNFDNLLAKADEVKTILLTPTPTPEPTPAPPPAEAPQQSYDYSSSIGGNSYMSDYVTTNTLSLAKYEKLKNGMSYEQVAEILGSKGNLVSSMDLLGVSTKSYGWYAEYGFPMVCVVFQDGKATNMYQIGLN